MTESTSSATAPLSNLEKTLLVPISYPVVIILEFHWWFNLSLRRIIAPRVGQSSFLQMPRPNQDSLMVLFPNLNLLIIPITQLGVNATAQSQLGCLILFLRIYNQVQSISRLLEMCGLTCSTDMDKGMDLESLN